MKSPLALLRELRAEHQVQTCSESHPTGAGEDVEPVCATCGELITGEEVTVIWGGVHHEGCARHLEVAEG